MRIPLIVALSWLVAACTAQPEAPPAAPIATAAPVAADSTAPGAAAAPAPAQPAQVATVQEARKAGYKIVDQNGQKVYCREQLKTGSNLRKETICLTEKELEQARAASQRNLDQMQRNLPPPHGT